MWTFMSTSAFSTTSRNQVLSKAIVHPAEKMQELIEVQPIIGRRGVPEIVRQSRLGTRPSLAWPVVPTGSFDHHRHLRYHPGS